MSGDKKMERSLQDQLDALASQMKIGAEELIRESSENIEVYDRLRWHMAAECSHAVAIMRVIDHREQVMAALVERLAPPQIAPPPQYQQVPPAPPQAEVSNGLRDIIQRMREAEARGEPMDKRRAPPPPPTQTHPSDPYQDWGHEDAYVRAYRQGGGQ
jgi:hypothetical protein